MERDGFAIALAWPETYCKQSGAWYDEIAHFLKISNNHHYKVGHAALVLVNAHGDLFYYDFGRYHAPFGYGRVRCESTDPELKLITKAKIKNGKIANFKEIVKELSQKEACHGEGVLKASYTPIQFLKARDKAELMLKKNPWKYGPFIYKGTNCSRFVRTIILSGNPHWMDQLKLRAQFTITSSPILNVKALSEKISIQPKKNKNKKPTPKLLNSVLPAPENKPHPHAKWFAGEGAGSWFTIEKNKNNTFIIQRYSENLEVEFLTEMVLKGTDSFNPLEEFQLQFPSHAKEIHLTQSQNKIILEHPIFSVN